MQLACSCHPGLPAPKPVAPIALRPKRAAAASSPLAGCVRGHDKQNPPGRRCWWFVPAGGAAAGASPWLHLGLRRQPAPPKLPDPGAPLLPLFSPPPRLMARCLAAVVGLACRGHPLAASAGPQGCKAPLPLLQLLSRPPRLLHGRFWILGDALLCGSLLRCQRTRSCPPFAHNLQLELLSLENCAVGDRGLQVLHQLSLLRRLDLRSGRGDPGPCLAPRSRQHTDSMPVAPDHSLLISQLISVLTSVFLRMRARPTHPSVTRPPPIRAWVWWGRCAAWSASTSPSPGSTTQGCAACAASPRCAASTSTPATSLVGGGALVCTQALASTADSLPASFPPCTAPKPACLRAPTL